MRSPTSTSCGAGRRCSCNRRRTTTRVLRRSSGRELPTTSIRGQIHRGMAMTTTSTFPGVLRGTSIAGVIVAAATLVGPASANKDPVTPQQLKAYQEVFMEEVRKGDLLFHGDAAMAEQLGVTLSTTG